MDKTEELRQKLEVMLPRNKAGNDMLRAIISIAKQQGKQEYYDEIKVFLNCEIRNASKEVEEGIEKYRNALKKSMKKHLKSVYRRKIQSR